MQHTAYTEKKRHEVLGANVKRFREEQGITIEELAKYVGKYDRDIRHFEEGFYDLPACVIYDIAEYLNVSLYRLFMDDGEWFEYNL